MGYTREEFCSPDFDFMILIDSESRDLMKANYKMHMQGEEVAPVEYAALTKDNSKDRRNLLDKAYLL
ncbi:hypothetical protein ACFLU6_04815 [Acidobacteriota bacterium]